MKRTNLLVVVALMTGGLHLYAQNHDVEHNCFITAEMDARLDGNDEGNYGITQLDIVKGNNAFHLGSSLLTSRSFDHSLWVYTEHSVAPNTDLLFATYYDSSPFAPSKWYARHSPAIRTHNPLPTLRMASVSGEFPLTHP